jgi:hypothetical protein
MRAILSASIIGKNGGKGGLSRHHVIPKNCQQPLSAANKSPPSMATRYSQRMRRQMTYSFQQIHNVSGGIRSTSQSLCRPLELLVLGPLQIPVKPENPDLKTEFHGQPIRWRESVILPLQDRHYGVSIVPQLSF